MFGIGYASLFKVEWFIDLKSIQNLVVPSFFLTRTIREDQGLVDGSIPPLSSISCTTSSAFFLQWKGSLLGLCLMGDVSTVSI